VHCIQHIKIANVKIHFLVKGTNYDAAHNTWQPEEHAMHPAPCALISTDKDAVRLCHVTWSLCCGTRSAAAHQTAPAAAAMACIPDHPEELLALGLFAFLYHRVMLNHFES
jgi:hypothetical protein